MSSEERLTIKEHLILEENLMRKERLITEECLMREESLRKEKHLMFKKCLLTQASDDRVQVFQATVFSLIHIEFHFRPQVIKHIFLNCRIKATLCSRVFFFRFASCSNIISTAETGNIT